MNFSYELSSIGWANVFLEINGLETYITPSYLTNSLGDLVKAIEILKSDFVDSDEVRSTSFFEWNSEPAIYKWFISKVNEEVIRIQIHMYEDETQETAEEIIEGLCQLDDFIFLLLESLEKLIKKHGIVGYRKQWNAHEFPISGYLQFKYYILNKDKLKMKIHNEDEWNEFYQSDIDDEIDLIKQVVSCPPTLRD